MCISDAKRDKNSIGWVERYKVAVGVAKALNYLHSDDGKESEAVFHMDIKSSNILLSDDFEPKVHISILISYDNC